MNKNQPLRAAPKTNTVAGRAYLNCMIRAKRPERLSPGSQHFRSVWLSGVLGALWLNSQYQAKIYVK
jgi:hypothetical protein